MGLLRLHSFFYQEQILHLFVKKKKKNKAYQQELLAMQHFLKCVYTQRKRRFKQHDFVYGHWVSIKKAMKMKQSGQGSGGGNL